MDWFPVAGGDSGEADSREDEQKRRK